MHTKAFNHLLDKLDKHRDIWDWHDGMSTVEGNTVLVIGITDDYVMMANLWKDAVRVTRSDLSAQLPDLNDFSTASCFSSQATMLGATFQYRELTVDGESNNKPWIVQIRDGKNDWTGTFETLGEAAANAILEVHNLRD